MLPAPDITFLYCFSLPVRKTLGSKTSKSKGEITPRVAILGRSWRFTNSGSLMAKAGVGGANLVAKNRLQLMSKGVPPTFHGKWLCWTILSCPDIICEYIWDFVNLPGKENTLAGELLVAAISHDSTHKQFDPKNYRFTDLPLFRKYLGLKIGWFFEGPHFLVLLVASIKLSTKHQTQLWLEVEMHTFTLHRCRDIQAEMCLDWNCSYTLSPFLSFHFTAFSGGGNLSCRTPVRTTARQSWPWVAPKAALKDSRESCHGGAHIYVNILSLNSYIELEEVWVNTLKGRT